MTVLGDILALAVTKEQADFLKNGGFVPIEELEIDLASSRPDGQTYRAMEGDKIIALCEFDESYLRPIRVFNL